MPSLQKLEGLAIPREVLPFRKHGGPSRKQKKYPLKSLKSIGRSFHPPSEVLTFRQQALNPGEPQTSPRLDNFLIGAPP